MIDMTRSGRKYVIELSGAMIFYAIAVFSTPWLLEQMEDGSRLTWPVALFPVIPTSLAVVAMVRFYRRADELQQRVLGETTFIAAMVTIFSSFAYGFLQIYVHAPRLPLIWILPAFFLLWLPIGPFVRRRYQ